MVNEELDSIKSIYDQQLSLAQSPSGAHVHKNMLKVAGVLRWSQELEEQTNLVAERLKDIDHGYVVYSIRLSYATTCIECVYVGWMILLVDLLKMHCVTLSRDGV